MLHSKKDGACGICLSAPDGAVPTMSLAWTLHSLPCPLGSDEWTTSLTMWHEWHNHWTCSSSYWWLLGWCRQNTVRPHELTMAQGLLAGGCFISSCECEEWDRENVGREQKRHGVKANRRKEREDSGQWTHISREVSPLYTSLGIQDGLYVKVKAWASNLNISKQPYVLSMAL